jgi:hypothetical protein
MKDEWPPRRSFFILPPSSLLFALLVLLCPIARAQPAASPVPHFSRDGQILHHYTPGRSIFVRTLFKLRPEFLAAHPQLIAKIKEAGVNTLTAGFFPNPADNGQATFQDWSRDWSNRWKITLEQARKADLSLCLIGDDLARTPRELHAVLTLPWAPHAGSTALTAARDSRRVVCIEMIDEGNALWGDTASPHDHRWSKKQPPIPDDAFLRLMAILNAVPNRPPLTWPVVGWASPLIAHAWMGNPALSDYATHYWYPGEFATLGENAHDMVSKIKARQRQLTVGRPFMVLTKITGAFYVKRGPGSEYVPRQDKLIDAPYTPASVAAQIIRSAALGASGVRVYAFDSLWADDRRDGRAGDTLQTGANPLTGVGLTRWNAMAAAFHLIEKIEPILLDRQLPAPDWGDDFTTAVRQGTTGRLFIAVSNADKTLSHPLDLTPWLYPGGKIRQYHLQGEHLIEEERTTPPQSASFTPGAAYVWRLSP